MAVDIERLRQFILEANINAGYGSGNESKWVKEKDDSTSIYYPFDNYEQAAWQFHDNYFGGEPYGGRTIVRNEGKPTWMMLYYGLVEPTANNILEIYSFLKQALLKPVPEIPLRGPKEFKKGQFLYSSRWKGDLTEYSGKETIYQKGIGVYRASFMGGLVNLR